MEVQVIATDHVDAGIIEAAYLSGFEPSAESISMSQLFVEARRFLLNLI